MTFPDNTKGLTTYVRIGRTMRKIPNLKFKIVDGKYFIQYLEPVSQERIWIAIDAIRNVDKVN